MEGEGLGRSIRTFSSLRVFLLLLPGSSAAAEAAAAAMVYQDREEAVRRVD